MKKQISPTVVMEFDDVGQGIPLVLLHAYPLSAAMWRPQAAALRDVCRVITPDLRGLGGTSGFEGPPSIEQMADDVHALLDQLKVHESIVLGGLSMGGYVSFAFARKYANRLRALVLADTRVEADNAEGKANRDKAIAFAEQHTALEVIEQMIPKALAPDTLKHRPEIAEEVRRIVAPQSRAGIVGALRAMRDRPDSTPLLAKITVPTLVIVGSEDAMTVPSMSETIAAGIKGSRLEIIPGAGHMSNLEKPDLFNSVVLSFLQSL
ncbi:MAG TPA: alpha/beta fold hydrolase [Gemmataceae bacterium]|nr:alpha/beta fold hydrolase [Gemmataceae bacterium]